MKPFNIYNQPPDDTGSRKKLVNRKGNIDNVEHAYSGIVNVYALVEPGTLSTIEEISAGAMSIPSGAKLYPQQKIGKKFNSEERDKYQEMLNAKRGIYTYGWGEDKHAKQMALVPMTNGIKVQGGAPITNKNINTYNDILINKQPELVSSYDESNPEHKKIINLARHYIMSKSKNRAGTPKYNDAVFKQANRLHVTTDTIERWIGDPRFSISMNLDKTFEKHGAWQEGIIRDIILNQMVILHLPDNQKAIALLKKNYGLTDAEISKRYEEISKQYTEIKEEPTKIHAPEFQKPAVVIDTSTLPIPIAGLMKVNKDDQKYMLNVPLDTMKALYNKDNPEKSPLVYAESDGGIIYYVDPSKIPTERRKRLQQIRVRRVIYRLRRKSNPKITSKKIAVKKLPKKVQCSNSSTMKKYILSKLRCKCRGKKK